MLVRGFINVYVYGTVQKFDISRSLFEIDFWNQSTDFQAKLFFIKLIIDKAEVGSVDYRTNGCGAKIYVIQEYTYVPDASFQIQKGFDMRTMAMYVLIKIILPGQPPEPNIWKKIEPVF